MHKIALFMLTLSVILSACCIPIASTTDPELATELLNNPPPVPEYFAGIYFGRESLCLGVYNGYFDGSPPYHSSINIGAEVLDRVHLTLNEKPVEFSHRELNRHFVMACFKVSCLEPGLHIAQLELENFAGERDTFIWAFRVKESLAGFEYDELKAKVELPNFELTPVSP